MLKTVRNKKCLFCDGRISGNQQFMLGGKNIPNRRSSVNNWLKEKPEHAWFWSGFGGMIDGVVVNYEFYLCPNHQTKDLQDKAYEWAQGQIDEQKLLAEKLKDKGR